MTMASDGFLNVDLEIGARTRADLAPLITALEERTFELFRGRIRSLYRLHVETIALTCNANANATIHALADTIEALPRRARWAWNAAKLRDFNVGVELARGVRTIELAVDNDAVRRVAKLGGRIVVTAYQEAAMSSGRRRKRAD
jgi:hypothetical protein